MDRANIDLRAILLVLFFEKLKERADLLADYLWIYALIGGNSVEDGERLAYAQQRWYDPETAQFTSEDPVKDGLNWYGYCGGNPIGMIDPDGLDSDQYNGDRWRRNDPSRYNESRGAYTKHGVHGYRKKFGNKKANNDGPDLVFDFYKNRDSSYYDDNQDNKDDYEKVDIATNHSGGGFNYNNWDKWESNKKDPDPVKPEKRNSHRHNYEQYPSVGAQIKSLNNDYVEDTYNDNRYPPGFTDEQKEFIDNFYKFRWEDNDDSNVYTRKFEPWDSDISDPMRDNLMILPVDIAGIALGKLFSKFAGVIVGKILSKYGDDVVKFVAKGANLKSLRSKAVRLAWKQEADLIRRTGQGTRAWNRAEIRELLSTGRVKNYIGHHINSVKGSPSLAGNPNNIRFIKGVKNHLIEHNGNFKNSTFGDLLNR